MTINLTLYHTSGEPFPAGVTLELLGDGNVLATGTAGAGGAVSFDADTSNVQRLAVRLASEAKPQPQAAAAGKA